MQPINAGDDGRWGEATPAQTPDPRWCDECQAWTFNVDHICTRYDGPTCTVDGCEAGTLFYTVGAPGYGSGIVCKNRHDFPTSPQGVLTPEQTR